MEPNVAQSVFGSVRDYAKRAIAPRRVEDVASTVFVIDDDISVRESLELLIRTAGGGCGSLSSAEEVLSEQRAPAACGFLLVLARPGAGGLELQQRRARRPDRA